MTKRYIAVIQSQSQKDEWLTRIESENPGKKYTVKTDREGTYHNCETGNPYKGVRYTVEVAL